MDITISDTAQKQTRRHALNNQVQRLQTRLQILRRRSDRYTWIRLATFVLGLLVSGVTVALAGDWQGLVVVVPAMAPFAIAIYAHRQIETSLARHEIWLQLKRDHIARMNLDWRHIPETLPVPPRFDHPFGLDLDLIGRRSLHRLLDTAVSQEGSQRLRDWLLETSLDPARTAQRQAQVQELARLPIFRDKLALNATLVAETAAEKWPGKRLLDWFDGQLETPSLRLALRLLVPLSLLTILLWFLNAAGLLPGLWVLPWIIYVAISLHQFRHARSIFEDAFFLRDGLEKLNAVFHFLETYRYADPSRLQTLCRPFLDAENRPSQQLKQVMRVVAAVSVQKNPILWFGLNAIIPWDIYFAHRLAQCKQKLAALLPTWLDIWFELEALNSLAGFAYLNPNMVFPEIVPNTDVFAAQALGHPLIPDETRICNDFNVDELGHIYLITGSNMAGKSSFLRTVGVNLALAYAGGPVLARSLRTSLFRLFTSVRITDSVTDGFSFFYAEVQRLRALLAALEEEGERPLCFLIDEIFRGTNNRERLIGSRAYIRALAGGNGVGVIATHDLELVNLADEIGAVTNTHFRDEVRNGRMVFDYKLHPGPCPTTNALKIMQLAGLPILPTADD